MSLRNGYNISYFKVYRIIKEKGLMIFPPQMPNPEGRMGYTTSRIIPTPCGMDWHVVKYMHSRDMNLITYLEDTLGTWQVPRLFKETTLENAVVVLRQTVNWDTPKVQSRCQHPSFNGTVCQACPVPVPLWSLCSFWKSWSEPCPFRLLPVPCADEGASIKPAAPTHIIL